MHTSVKMQPLNLQDLEVQKLKYSRNLRNLKVMYWDILLNAKCLGWLPRAHHYPKRRKTEHNFAQTTVFT